MRRETLQDASPVHSDTRSSHPARLLNPGLPRSALRRAFYGACRIGSCPRRLGSVPRYAPPSRRIHWSSTRQNNIADYTGLPITERGDALGPIHRQFLDWGARRRMRRLASPAAGQLCGVRHSSGICACRSQTCNRRKSRIWVVPVRAELLCLYGAALVQCGGYGELFHVQISSSQPHLAAHGNVGHCPKSPSCGCNRGSCGGRVCAGRHCSRRGGCRRTCHRSNGSRSRPDWKARNRRTVRPTPCCDRGASHPTRHGH